MARRDKLAGVADAVVTALVPPLGELAAHAASSARVGRGDAFHTDILSHGGSPDFVTAAHEQAILVGKPCSQIRLDKDFVR